MGPPKKNPKKFQSQLRPRTTRSSKARLLSDPMENTALLTEQLRSLGLYAAPTVGDGNCLFRALSDQLYGTPSRYAQLRRDVCDWIARHKSRYEPFVEDERGIDVHLRCMRENATYGGHMELSAFAHLTRRNVKVIQPGLVYVIEWAGGAGPPSPTLPTSPTAAAATATASPSASSSSLSSLSTTASGSDGHTTTRRRKDKDRHDLVDVIDVEGGPLNEGTIYVAYHDWEHFSSVRNLKGPHTGLPDVLETSSYLYQASPTADSKQQSKADAKERKRLETEAKERAKRERRERLEQDEEEAFDETTPKRALPKVRLKLSSASPTKAVPPTLPLAGRVQRSPKRSFDEGSGSAGSESESIAKRTRSAYAYVGRASAPGETEARTSPSSGTSGTSLSLSLSPPALSSSSSLSSLSSVSPSPPPEPEPVIDSAKPLTRRQRKALGLPKTRAAAAAAGNGAGKIVIPGGRYEGSGSGEWQRNGTGRLDVRGFRELKI
ncbi:hypothetical protein GGX14DRAFT_527285 [Mycena pura]|uniref:OTU domain-containing protein n=1 Tax=Mycena pura TaxID=153505 RepID=A0AAD6UU48_9AGAR|nr:hypothetical protein GGX14DRAFT_527285 [Mycena pura]